jgi:hypothetical protein
LEYGLIEALTVRGYPEHLLHERRAPKRRAVLGHVLEQLFVVLPTQLFGHRDRLVDRICDLLAIPRVDDDRAVQRLRGAGKLREDHHTLALLLASHILVRDLFRARPMSANERTREDH